MKNYLAEIKSEAGREFLIVKSDTREDARSRVEDYMRDHKELQTIKSINKLDGLSKKYKNFIVIT